MLGLNGNEVKRVIHVMINNDGNDGGGIWVLIVLSVDCAKRKNYDESKKTYAPRMSLL